MRTVMDSNPMIQQIAQQNPEMGAVLRDPEMMRQAMEMARNPGLMQEMLRTSDRAMSNVESMPGGFDALRRLQQDVTHPLMDSLPSMFGAQGGANTEEGEDESKEEEEEDSNPAERRAPPNPCGNAPAPPPAAGANPFAAMRGSVVPMPVLGVPMLAAAILLP
eukprot:EC690123.1.p1 GENE.EC690123.1~~EC690123.1.p1  ORF type:complete len:163 (+),score=28.43 EC690123.1:64-552(+)